MTGNPESALAKNSDIHLDVSVEEEACILHLAPTTMAWIISVAEQSGATTGRSCERITLPTVISRRRPRLPPGCRPGDSHPGEAFHGDLGMISKDDVVLALSYSGVTDERL